VAPGATLVHEGQRIWKVTNPGFASNTYIHASEQPGACFLVDPGLDAEPIDAALRELGVVPRVVLCTHGHFDHVGSASFFQDTYGARVFLHAADVPTMKASNFLLMAFKLPQRIVPPKPELVGDRFTLDVGGETVRYHATAGHTPGSCVIEFGPVVFTGDTLYCGGMSLSRLPGEDPERLRASLRAVWDRFPAEALVCPGHGEPAAFGWIKAHNAPLLQFLASGGAGSAEVLA
jgi:hydroxyacylglutathione hydrolase